MPDTYSQRLLDDYACRRLIEKYWWTERERDSAALVTCFTENAKWGAAVGREAIKAQAERYFEAMRSIAANPTSIGGIDIRVDGDQAAGSIHGVAHLLVAQGDGSQKVVVVDATYEARFRREQGEWRISSLVGPEDPDTPHGGNFQFTASAVPLDFGISQEG